MLVERNYYRGLITQILWIDLLIFIVQINLIFYTVSVKKLQDIIKKKKSAVHLLGLMFSGKNSMVCRSCGALSITLTEHILLFCISNEQFRNKLWKNMFNRFGIKFFNTFISLSPARQVNGLFSGCFNILENDTDINDCLKIFVTSLTKITNIKSYSYML